MLAVGGTHFVVYNRAGSELTVCSRTRTLYTQRFDEDILLCAMSNNNSLAVVTDADRFAGWVHIYDPSMRELYSWRMPQSMGTPIALDFAPDNRRFASGMIAARDGQLNCSVYFMSLDSGTEGLLYTADAGSMLLRLDWQSENRVMAVFDTYIAVIDPRTAAEVARYDYGGAALQSVAPGRRQTALLLNVHGGNSLVTLSESLTVMSEIPARRRLRSRPPTPTFICSAPMPSSATATTACRTGCRPACRPVRWRSCTVSRRWSLPAVRRTFWRSQPSSSEAFPSGKVAPQGRMRGRLAAITNCGQ